MEAQNNKTIQIPIEDGKEKKPLNNAKKSSHRCIANGQRKTRTKEFTTVR